MRSAVIWVRYRGEFPLRSFVRTVDSLKEHRNHVAEKRLAIRLAGHVYRGSWLLERNS